MSKRDFTLTKPVVYIHVLPKQLILMGLTNGDEVVVNENSANIKIKKKNNPTNKRTVKVVNGALYIKITEKQLKKMSLKKNDRLELETTNTEITMKKK